MDNEAKKPPPPPHWQVFCQLTTKQLVQVSAEFSNELKRRADAETDPRKQHLLYLANVRLTETRAYLRGLQSIEHELAHGAELGPLVEGLFPSSSPAPSVPDSQHGADQPGAAHVRAPSGAPSTTTGGAGGSLPLCTGASAGGFVCMLPFDHKGACVSLEVHRLHCALGCALCAAHPLPYGRPAPTSPSPSELQPSGQRGPKAAEGAPEGGRAEQARVELAVHRPECLCGECRERRELVANLSFIGGRRGGVA